MDILANVFVMFLVKLLGKRKLLLSSLVAAVCVCFGLSYNAHQYVPSGVSSFDDDAATAAFVESGPKDNWVALVLVVALAFIGNVALCVPWSMISEVYPFR